MTLLLWFVNTIEQRLDCVISQAKNQWNYYLIALKKKKGGGGGGGIYTKFEKKKPRIINSWQMVNFLYIEQISFTMNKLDLKFVDMSLHWY